MNFYVVAKGRKPGIYLTWPECNAQVNKYKGAVFKKFTSLADAEAFYQKHHNGVLPKDKNYRNTELQKLSCSSLQYKHIDNCLLCGKPFKQALAKGGTRKNHATCPACRKKQTETNKRIKILYGKSIKKLTLPVLIYIKEQHRCADVFAYIEQHPYLATKRYSVQDNLPQEKLRQQRLLDAKISSKDGIPAYITEIFGPDKRVLKVSGNMKNPKVFYHCKKCNQDFTVYYRKYKEHQGHDCAALLSSGEAIVREFLMENHINFVSEEATLKCINPDTGHQLPYDFEIVGQKLLIEVQGEQHCHFIECFHVDESGFEYQKWKDAYKRSYAERCGYRLIEIWYDDIKNGRYKSVILESLEQITPLNV